MQMVMYLSDFVFPFLVFWIVGYGAAKGFRGFSGRGEAGRTYSGGNRADGDRVDGDDGGSAGLRAF